MAHRKPLGVCIFGSPRNHSYKRPSPDSSLATPYHSSHNNGATTAVAARHHGSRLSAHLSAQVLVPTSHSRTQNVAVHCNEDTCFLQNMFIRDVETYDSGFEEPYTPEEAHFGADNIGWQALGPALGCTLLASIVVGARWYSRRTIARCLGVDDYVILLSMVCSFMSRLYLSFTNRTRSCSPGR